MFREHRISWVAVRVLESRPRSLIKLLRENVGTFAKVEKHWGTSVSQQELQRPKTRVDSTGPHPKVQIEVPVSTV